MVHKGIFSLRQREYLGGRSRWYKIALPVRTGLEHKTQGGSLMAIESHLAELEKRHQALEQEINEALTHPSTDDLKVVELKRRKLHVKDEIARLRHDVSIH